ncbi:hypothetical protein ACFVXG_20365 [Kitasatospora sp. NPDC058162]|uniref:hypothetical protein n=1 Tax=Kitasatospora sp. NPDC058162 TaxID=3346362 RepID=UPI0036D8ECC7
MNVNADTVADLCTGRCTTDSPELPAEHDDDCPVSAFAGGEAGWPDGYRGEYWPY